MNIEDEDSPYIVTAERAVDGINQIGNAGAFLGEFNTLQRTLALLTSTLVDVLPIRESWGGIKITKIEHVIPAVRHLPPWFPGAGFKRQAAEWEKAVSDTYNIPWSDV